MKYNQNFIFNEETWGWDLEERDSSSGKDKQPRTLWRGSLHQSTKLASPALESYCGKADLKIMSRNREHSEANLAAEIDCFKWGCAAKRWRRPPCLEVLELPSGHCTCTIEEVPTGRYPLVIVFVGVFYFPAEMEDTRAWVSTPQTSTKNTHKKTNKYLKTGKKRKFNNSEYK